MNNLTNDELRTLSVWMWENTDQKKLRIWTLSRSDTPLLSALIIFNFTWKTTENLLRRKLISDKLLDRAIFWPQNWSCTYLFQATTNPTTLMENRIAKTFVAKYVEKLKKSEEFVLENVAQLNKSYVVSFTKSESVKPTHTVTTNRYVSCFVSSLCIICIKQVSLCIFQFQILPFLNWIVGVVNYYV